MKLAIFDIDGTLTRTTHVDDLSLAAGFGRFLGVHLPRVDWFEFGTSTDQGLCLAACRRYLKRDPTDAEISQARDMFLHELRTRIEADRSLCECVPGAKEVFGHLQRAGWRLGVASGAWEQSARTKLGFAGVELPAIPATFSFAHPDRRPAEREEIVGGTMSKLLGDTPRDHASIVYIGDGVWDARASRNLGIGFVGLRHDGEETKLRAEGASAILPNFMDVDRLLHALDKATVPMLV
ncbi:MAG: HAD family hydrolase [Phycisphaerales bacterium]|jgi:phosphoglycolate phosphatase-like HAD superfamily hydrolase